jgi:hypothetical protein
MHERVHHQNVDEGGEVGKADPAKGFGGDRFLSEF